MTDDWNCVIKIKCFRKQLDKSLTMTVKFFWNIARLWSNLACQQTWTDPSVGNGNHKKSTVRDIGFIHRSSNFICFFYWQFHSGLKTDSLFDTVAREEWLNIETTNGGELPLTIRDLSRQSLFPPLFKALSVDFYSSAFRLRFFQKWIKGF